MYKRVTGKGKASYESHKSHGFFALRFAFFAAFFASPSSDVETDAPREESLVDDDCAGVASFAFLLWSVVWEVDSESDRFSYPTVRQKPVDTLTG